MPGSFVAAAFLEAPEDARVDRCAEEWEADLAALSAQAFAKKHGSEAIALAQRGVALVERRAFAGDPAKLAACVRGTALGLQTLQRIASALAFKPLTLEFLRLKLAAALLDADMVSEAGRQLDLVAGSLRDAYLERGSASSPAALPAPARGKTIPRLGLAGVLWHHTAARVCIAAESEPLLAEAARAIAGGSVATWLSQLAAEGPPQQGQQSAAKYAASFRALASALWREARLRAPQLVPVAATAFTTSLLLVAAAGGDAGYTDGDDAPDTLRGALAAMGDAQDTLLADRTLTPLACASGTAPAGTQRSAAKAGVASSLHALAALECAATGDSAAARLRVAAARAATALTRTTTRGGAENGPVRPALVEWVEAGRPSAGAGAPALAASASLLDAIIDAASSSPWQPLCDAPLVAPLFVGAMSRAARLLACLGRGEKECGKPIQLARLAVRTAAEKSEVSSGSASLAFSAAKAAAYAAWAAVGARCAEAAAAAADEADPASKAWRRAASQGDGAAHVRTLVHRAATLAEEAAGHARSLTGEEGALGVDPHRPCTAAITQAFAALRDVLRWTEPCTRTLLAATHSVFDPGALPPVLTAPPDPGAGAGGTARVGPTATPAPQRGRTASRMSHAPATPAPPASAARSGRRSGARAAKTSVEEEEEEEEGDAPAAALAVSSTPAPKARTAPREAREALGAFDALLSVGERAILGLVEALDAMGGGELSGGAAQCGALLRDAARLRLRLRLLPALSECDEEGDPVIARHTAAYATLCTKAAEAAVAAVAALAGSGPTDASLRREVQHVQALEHAMANDATAMYRDGRPALAAVPAAMAATLACLRCAVTASGGAESGAGAGGETAVGMGVCQTMDAAAARLELAALCASKPSGGKCGDARAAYATAAALHAAAHAVRGPMDPGEEPPRAGDAAERLLGQAACQALAASLAAAPRAGSGPEAGSVENGDGAIAPLPLLVLRRLAPGRACRVADSDSHAAWSSALESLEQQCGMAPTPPAVGCASTFGATLALLSQAHPALHPRWAAACCAAASTAALARAASEGAAAVEAATRALTRAHPDGVAPRDVPGALERVATASGGERTTAIRAAAAEHCWREACALWEDRHAAALGGDRRLARRLADTAAAAHALSLGRALAVAARLRGMDCLPSPHHAVLSPSPAALQQPSSVGAATVPADRAALPSLADALAALEGVGDALLDATVPFLQRAADEDGGGSKEEGEGDSAAAPLAAALAHCAALLRGGGSHGRPALAVAAVAGAVTGAAGDAAAATAARAVAEAVATSDGFHLNASSGELSRGAGAARRGRGGRPRDEDAAAATRWCEQAWSQAQGMPSLGDAASAAAAAWRGDRHVQEPFMELLALLASRASEAAAARGQVQLAFLTARLARAVVAPAHGWVGAAARLMVPAAALEPAQALAYLAEEAGGPGDLPDHASADAPRDGDGTGARVAALRQRLRAVLGQAGEAWSERLPWVLAQAAVVAEIPDVQAGGGGAVEEAPLGPDSAWTPLRALSAVAGGAQRAAAWQRLLTAGQGSTSGPDGELGQLVALLLARRPALVPGVGGMREGVGPGAPVLHSAGVTFTAAQGRRAQVPRAAAANVEGGNKDELDGTSSCESSPRGASPLRTGTRRALFAEPGPGPSSATPATPRARWSETTPGSAVGAGHSTPGLSSAPAEAGDDGEDGSSRAPPLDAADSARVLDILAALSATTSPEWGGSIAVATTLGAAAARAWHTALVRPTWSGVGAGAAGHGSSLSHAFTTVAWLWHVRGDADRALFYASQGVVVASACGDLVATTSALSRLALTAADAGLARLASEASAQCGEVVGLPSEPTASANAPPPGADTPPALAWALACLARGAATAPMEPIAGADREGDSWVRAARDAALGPQGMGAGGVDTAIRAVGLTRVGIAAEACSRLVARATAASCPVPADEADIARSLATALPSPAAHDLSAALIPGAERAEALAAAAKVVTAHSRGAAVSAGAVRVAGRYLAAWGGGDVWERVWCLAASIGPSHWLACARALGTHCGSDWPRVGDTASGLLAACLAAQQSAARDGVDSGLASALEAMTLEGGRGGGVATPGRNRGDGAQGPTPGLAALRDPLVALAALLPGAHVRSVPQEAMRARAGAMAATVGAWLPAHWRVVLMARAPDGALIIGGVQSSSAPYVVRVYVGGCAPVEETARLLEEAEEHARASASRARSLSSSEKREWWAARRTADEKLARLLRRTQQQWLGPWRALVMPTASSADDSERESGPSSSQGGAAGGEAVSECGQGPDAAALEALRCAVGPEGVTPCTVAAAAQVVRCVRQGHLGVWEGVCAVLALAGRLPVASPAAMGEAMREGWSVLAGVAGDVRAALAPGGTHGMAGEGGGMRRGRKRKRLSLQRRRPRRLTPWPSGWRDGRSLSSRLRSATVGCARVGARPSWSRGWRRRWLPRCRRRRRRRRVSPCAALLDARLPGSRNLMRSLRRLWVRALRERRAQVSAVTLDQRCWWSMRHCSASRGSRCPAWPAPTSPASPQCPSYWALRPCRSGHPQRHPPLPTRPQAMPGLRPALRLWTDAALAWTGVGADFSSVLRALCVKNGGKYYMRDEAGAEYEFPNTRSVVVPRSTAAQLCEDAGLVWTPTEVEPVLRSLRGWAEAGQGGGGRRAVVSVMGHVDHGKTTLSDRLLGQGVAAGEVGGITQRVYRNELAVDEALPPVTLLDTPGHDHFFRLREDSTRAADAAVLLVAADEGFLAETEECVACLADAGISVLAALSKCDLPRASHVLDVARLGAELEARGLRAEACTPLSSVTGEGVETVRAFLRDRVAARVAPPSPGEAAQALVLDAQFEHGRGLELTVLVGGGALRVGQDFVVEDLQGRVRSLHSVSGERIQVGEAGQVVRVAGLRGAGASRTLPPVGEYLFALSREECKALKEYRAMVASLGEHCVRGDPPLVRQRQAEEEQQQRVQEERRARVQSRVEALQRRYGSPAAAPPAPGGEDARPGGDAEEGGAGHGDGRSAGNRAAAAATANAADERRMRGDAARAVLEGDLGAARDQAALLKAPHVLHDGRLPVVIKADGAASLGTICDILESDLPVKLVSVGVGNVTRHDIDTAGALGCPIFCFNVSPSRRTVREAQAGGVELQEHQVLHEMVAELEAWSRASRT